MAGYWGRRDQSVSVKMTWKPYYTAVLWLLAITWLSTRGGIPLPGFNLIGTDKLAHAAAYGLLFWTIYRAFPLQNHASALVFWLFASLYGALMEWVQFTYFPNRLFEYDDMLANAIGAFIAWSVLGLLKIMRKR